MSGAGKWFLARPVFKGPGPEFFGRTSGRYLPPLVVSGSTSMSAS
jgi:hypothetical protein